VQQLSAFSVISCCKKVKKPMFKEENTMLISIAIMLMTGMAAGWVCKKLRLPALLGMLLTGIMLGPYALNLIDTSILNISAELRRIALIIILARAGLSLDMADLKRVGRPAVLMCFVPACFELLGMMLLAPRLLGISVLDAAIMGAVVGAVSPAVIVPKMLKLMEEGCGTAKSIPQMILAGASVDDVFVIVLFSAVTGLATGESISPVHFITIPVSIILGIGLGLLAGWLLAGYFKRIHIRDTVKVLIILCLSFVLVSLEDLYSHLIPFSALIAIMALGIALQKISQNTARRLADKCNKLWIPAELLLFILVGASFDIRYALGAGKEAVLLILAVLLFRMAGVFCCLVKTNLTVSERLFCMLAYMPKATVQAAIGGIPLAMGLPCGTIVLTVAVLSIIITAPLGAFLIDCTYKKLLKPG